MPPKVSVKTPPSPRPGQEPPKKPSQTTLDTFMSDATATGSAAPTDPGPLWSPDTPNTTHLLRILAGMKNLIRPLPGTQQDKLRDLTLKFIQQVNILLTQEKHITTPALKVVHPAGCTATLPQQPTGQPGPNPKLPPPSPATVPKPSYAEAMKKKPKCHLLQGTKSNVLILQPPPSPGIHPP
jgi:hypothetical protein